MARLDRLEALVRSLRIEDVAADLPDATVFVVKRDDCFDVSAGKRPGAPVVAIRLAHSKSIDPLIGAVGGFTLTLGPQDKLYSLLNLLTDEVQNPRCGAQAALHGYSEALIVHFLRGATEAGVARSGLLAGLSDPQLSRALVAMHSAPSTVWRAEDLAAEAGMSRSSFMARFRAVMQETPMAYLRRWRVNLAAEELGQGARVGDVARRSGYGSHDAFARAFKSVYGHAPSEMARHQNR